MQSAVVTVTEFETRVSKQSSRSSNVSEPNTVRCWDPKIARAEFMLLNEKLEKLYGHNLIPLVKELGFSSSWLSESNGPTANAQSEDFASTFWMTAIVTICLLLSFAYLYSHFNEEAEPHFRSLPKKKL